MPEADDLSGQERRKCPIPMVLGRCVRIDHGKDTVWCLSALQSLLLVCFSDRVLHFCLGQP
jgi:hypothetical protein